MHVTHFIAHKRGIEPDFTNDEPLTYLAAWVTDEMYFFIKKKGFKVKTI